MSKRKSVRHPKTTNRKMAANAKQATMKSPKRTPVASAENSSAPTPVSEQELPVIQIRKDTTSKDAQKISGQENESFDESQNGTDAASAAEGSMASATTHPSADEEVPAVDISEPSQHAGSPSNPQTKEFNVSLVAAPIQAYQATLLGTYSANLDLALEFAARLVTVASPVELLALSSEFASKRVGMFMRHSEQMTDLLVRRSWAH